MRSVSDGVGTCVEVTKMVSVNCSVAVADTDVDAFVSGNDRVLLTDISMLVRVRATSLTL